MAHAPVANKHVNTEFPCARADASLNKTKIITCNLE